MECDEELNSGFDRFMTATIILQDLSAELSGDESHRFSNLSEDGREAVLHKVIRYGVLGHNITTPEQLHNLNTSLQATNGWSVGEFDLKEKTSPLLCSFDALPEKIKTFLQASFVVLDELVLPKPEVA